MMTWYTGDPTYDTVLTFAFGLVVLVFIGANPCLAHPILWQRVLLNSRDPEIVVIDPRRTETAAQAGQHLALKPKSDLTLLYGLSRILIEKGWISPEYIQNHTRCFAEFKSFVKEFRVFVVIPPCSPHNVHGTGCSLFCIWELMYSRMFNQRLVSNIVNCL